jgi:hypothetical protein
MITPGCKFLSMENKTDSQNDCWLKRIVLEFKTSVISTKRPSLAGTKESQSVQGLYFQYLRLRPDCE